MNTGTALLSLLVLGGAGYAGYLYVEDKKKTDSIPPTAAYDRWWLVTNQAKGNRYVVYMEGFGPKGFGPIVTTMVPGTTTNFLATARKALEKVESDTVKELKGVANGTVSSDAILGITSQEIGVYDIQTKIVVESRTLESPKAPLRRKSSARRKR